MKLVKRKSGSIIGQCEKCNRTQSVSFDNVINPRASSIELRAAVQCECGEYHNLIVDVQEHHVVTTPPSSSIQQEDTLKCLRCGSTQLHAGSKGFGLGKAAIGGITIGPLGLLGGLVGHKKVMITCLSCGYKWQAGK